MGNIRSPAVAGMFYPGDAGELKHMLDSMLQHAKLKHIHPRAIIAPHAGYVYSGEIAASAYKELEDIKKDIQRVVLLGPSHRVPFVGCAVSDAEYFRTPLGDIALDTAAIKSLLQYSQVQVSAAAHAQEHSLEVHLPFLQTVLDEFTLVPIVVGDADAESVSEILEFFWQDKHTIFVISSDLSHYHDYATAIAIDEQTTSAIKHLQPENISYEMACGRNPVNGLLKLAKKHGLKAVALDLRNSGDTAGSKDQVVGYGAYGFC